MSRSLRLIEQSKAAKRQQVRRLRNMIVREKVARANERQHADALINNLRGNLRNLEENAAVNEQRKYFLETLARYTLDRYGPELLKVHQQIQDASSRHRMRGIDLRVCKDPSAPLKNDPVDVIRVDINLQCNILAR